MSFLSKPIGAARREWDVFLETLRSPGFRELIRWCLPALILGGIARLLLTVHFPYGIFQADTPDFLVTAERLLRHHTLVIHGKKAFLAPILFTIPFLLHIPALIVIPIAQHMAGLVATVLAGGLVRCLFRFWRWCIVPVTILYTLNPALLWYEHALLAESHYLYCVTATALAGALLVRSATLRRFVWLIVALFFTAGSRPEGKLFVAFGLGVVALVYLGDWKLWARRVGVMLVCCAGIWMCTRSTQAGLLLYATVLPLAPASSTVAPGIDPYIAPLRTAAFSEEQVARTKLNTVERKAYNAIRDYLKSQGKKGDDAHVGALGQKLAIEAMRRHPGLLLMLASDKLLLTFRSGGVDEFMETSGGFTPDWIWDKQAMAFGRRGFMKPMMKGVTGQPIDGAAATAAFLHAHYTPLQPDWFNALQSAWSTVTLGGQNNPHGTDKRYMPRWPPFFLVAAVGMLIALIPRDGLWRFHLPWVATFLGVWFVVVLTGVVNARYRFVFEPFCFLYAFLLLDFLASAGAAVFHKRAAGA